MNIFTKKITVFFSTLFSLFTVFYLVFANKISAMCPVCTIAVGAGLGLSRWLGVDDVISGIWIGAVLLSSALWFYNWLAKKYSKLGSRYFLALSIIVTFGIVLIPLLKTGVIGHPFNTILGIDKLVFGNILGALTFTLSIWADKKVRKIKGKQLFQFQKVVFPVVLLILVSAVMFFITK